MKTQIKLDGTGLRKKPEQEAFNVSFMTPANTRWYHYVLNWLPQESKPLVFLPCAAAYKTREKFGKKKISQSTTHQFLSAITLCTDFEQVIISEPCTIIPYAIEDEHPDYNIPPEDLSIQSEQIFIERLSNWLNIVKRMQPARKYIYYIGATHHYFILYFANEIAMKPFEIIYEIPEGGTKGYGKAAQKFKETINNLEKRNIEPVLKEISIEKHINSRGRYTHRQFWIHITMGHNSQRKNTPPIFKKHQVKVTTREDYITGFETLYPSPIQEEITNE